MLPDDARHGSEAGHEQHLRDKEDACDACIDADLKASRRRTKLKTMGAQFLVPLGGLYDELQALRDRGAVVDDIAEWANISDSQVWRALNNGPEGKIYARTYRALRDMRPGPILTPVGAQRRVRRLMARIRTTKPSFWGSGTIARLGRDARLTHARTHLVRRRRRPLPRRHQRDQRLHLPQRRPAAAKVRKWLDEIAKSGLVHEYERDGVRYGCFPSWHEHQVINRYTPSTLPEPDVQCVPRSDQGGGMRTHGQLTEPHGVTPWSLTTGREGKGIGREVEALRAIGGSSCR
jgi:hypothetical protein